MAYKLYVNDELFRKVYNALIIDKGVIVLGGKEYEFDNTTEDKDFSVIMLQYIDQLIEDTPSSAPA